MHRGIVVLAICLIAAACGSAVSEFSRAEGFWEVESFRLDGSSQDVSLSANVVHTPWVSIEGDLLEGQAGCNGLGGSFLVTDDGNLVMSNVVMEAMFCVAEDSSGDDDALMQADFAFGAVMWEGEGIVDVTITGDKMVWSNGDNSITFISVSAAPTTEPFVPPKFTEIGRLNCAPNYVNETRVPNTGKPPLEIAQDANPNVVRVEPGKPLWHSGIDAEGNVIVELSLGDAGPESDYQVWSCDD